MLKHTDISTRRIRRLLEDQLKPAMLGDRVPLDIYFCPEPHHTEQQAREMGPWEQIEPGFEYGPAYRVVWFWLKGVLPEEWKGQEVGLNADLGGERTLWLGNVPERGIDDEHPICTLHQAADGGEKIDLVIQAHARARHLSVYEPVPPRKEKTETVQAAELAVLNGQARSLYYDVLFAEGLMNTKPADDPAKATLLRALNEVADIYRPDTRAACRKIISRALKALGGKIPHSITPVGHAHLDTAWLWPLSITRLKMAHTTATQLDLMKHYPEFIFCHSQGSQYEWIEQDYPELFDRIKQAVERGQWEPVGSMWVEADCNLSGGEALVRQFFYGRRYFEQKFGVTTSDIWLPDVFGYSAAIPQIARKLGITSFMTNKISWNQINKFPHNTFWWQGIDGSKLWTHFLTAEGYCGTATPESLLRCPRRNRDSARNDQSLYLFGHGDGGGGPTVEHLELIRRARISTGMPVIKHRSASEFYKAAIQSSKDLCTWVGELYFELHRGTYTSQAANKRYNRQCEFLMRDLEWLCSFSPDFRANYPASKIEQLWKLVLLNQFHDIIPGSSVEEVYQESIAQYEQVVKDAEQLLDQKLKTIAQQVNSSNMSRPIAIFQNSSVSGQLELPCSDQQTPNSLRVGSSSYPVQSVTEFGQPRIITQVPTEALGRVCVAELSDLPAMNAKRPKSGRFSISDDRFTVKFDRHGNIRSILLKDGEPVEFIQPGRMANMFEILDDRPLNWDAWETEIYAQGTAQPLAESEHFEIVESGPVRVAAEIVKRFGKSTLRQRISLGPTPGIRFDTEVDWQEEHKMLKVAFPVNVHSSNARYEIQFGNIERPTHFNTSWDIARFEVCAQKWVDLSEGGHGVALLNDCKYGHDIHQNVIRQTLLRSPRAPDPTCDIGVHRFTYVLLPHMKGYAEGGVVSAAYALNSPARWAWIEPEAGKKCSPEKFVQCTSKNLVIETVKKAEDSSNLIIRLYECHQTRGSALVSFDRDIKGAWLADLNEKPIRIVRPLGNTLRISYKPFEIITLLVEFSD